MSRRNPFDLSSSPASTSSNRVDLARAVSGSRTAYVMKRLLRSEGKVRGGAKASSGFVVTEAEQAEVATAQLEFLRASEAGRLLAFFGEPFEVPPLPEEITPELKEFWEQNYFKLEYWPKIEMSEDRDFPGWEHKPGKRYAKYGIEFFDEVKTIQALPENAHNPRLQNLSPLDLPGAWVLKDARPKPSYDNGNQIYENDTLFEKALGTRTKKYPGEFSKPDFWSPFFKALKIRTIPGVVVRLPRVIEANVMGQREGFHDTDTYEWCEEVYGSGKRISSGASDRGGASFLDWADYANIRTGCRPLIVFPTV